MVVFFTSLCLHFLGLAFVSSPHWLAHCWHKDGSPLSTQHGWLQVDPKLDVLEGLGVREGCFSNEKQRYSLNTLGFVVPLSCRVILIKVWQSLCELQLIDIPEFVFYYLTVMLLHIIQLAMSVFYIFVVDYDNMVIISCSHVMRNFACCSRIHHCHVL